MKVTYYYRSKVQKAHSIERLFDTILAEMPAEVEPRKEYSRYGGSKPLGCLYNALEAIGRQGRINHITGEIHYVSAFMRKGRTVTTIHDCVNLTKLTGIRRTLFRFVWYVIPVWRSGMLTVISEATRRELQSIVKVPDDRVRVVYDCVGPEFTARPKTLDFEKPTILMLGSNWNKNQARQAEALAGIPCVLNLIGKPSPELLEVVERHGIEHRFESGLTDEEVFDRYVACDLVMFASLYEGFGMPIVEANAVGRPVITANATSMPEVAGDAALVVDPLSVEEIRAAVLRLKNDPALRERLVENGYRNAARFSAKKIAAEFAEIYRSLAR